MRFCRSYFFLILPLSWVTTVCFAANVTLDIQPRLIRMGETATATVTFHDMANAPQLTFPDISGLQINGPSMQTSTSIVNGQRSSRVSLVYQVFPTKPGAYTLGPYQLPINNETYDLPAVSLEVRASDSSNAAASNAEAYFVRMELSGTQLFVQQVFDIILKIYTIPEMNLDRNIQLLGGVPESGFLVDHFEEIQADREEVDNIIYDVRKIRCRAQALTTGTFTLQPQIRVNLLTKRQNRQRDSFFEFNPFDGGYQATPVTLSSQPQSVTIQSIPLAGRPADFSGAIGQFALHVEVKPTTVQVGDPITVSTILRGMGNITMLKPPAYSDTDEYKAYEARQSDQRLSEDQREGLKAFDQVVIPRTDTLSELPALKFSYFDPISARYRTLSQGPFPIHVNPAPNGAQSMMLQTPVEAIGNRTLILGSDILYLHPMPAHWKKPHSQTARFVILALHAAAPAFLIGLYITAKRRRHLSVNKALARRQKAPHHARAALKKAEAVLQQPAPDISLFFTHLYTAVSTYFAHRFNLAAGEADAVFILSTLRKGELFSTDFIQSWETFFQLADQSRFANPPTLTHEELEQWVDKLSSLLRQVEKIRS